MKISTSTTAVIFYFLVSSYGSVRAQERPGTLSSLEREITTLIEQAKPAVASISARVTRSYEVAEEGGLFGIWGQKKSHRTVTLNNIGSGLILDSDGYIVTKSSVVPEVAEIRVTLVDGRTFPGEYLGADHASGLAVIKIQDGGLCSARIGDAKQVRPGAWVTVIGNSLGISPSVSFGLVSGIRKDGLLQLSAAVAAGNAGSPVFNTDGEVIGLVAASVNVSESRAWTWSGFQSSGNSLAYPIDAVKSIAERIIEWDSWGSGWLGITANGQEADGRAVITSVAQGGPASEAGLCVGDMLMSFAGLEVEGIEEIARAVRSTSPGQEVTVGLIRDGEPMELSVVIGKRPSVSHKADSIANFDSPIQMERLTPVNWPQVELDNQQLYETIKYLRNRINILEKEVHALKRLRRQR